MKQIILTILLLIPSAVFADSIQLPTTGLSQSGGIIGVGQRDANYTVQWTRDDNAQQSPRSSAWVGGTTDIKWANAPWICLTANCLANVAGGVYSYQVTFDLLANITSITGSLYADDRVMVLFNGKVIVDLPEGNGSGYWSYSLSSFIITSGFLLGQNTLEFRVLNTNPGTPSGLAVTRLTANLSPVPEPMSLTLLGIGLLGIASKIKKKK